MAAELDTNTSSSLYQQVDNYDWDNDPEFQGGLQAILGSASSPEQIAHLTLRARCFYYSRKFGTKVDFDGYQAWRALQQAHTNGLAGDALVDTDAEPVVPASSTEATGEPSALGNAPTPASFAEICQMIAEGKPIPGIKDIPDTVLEGQATESTASRRRKPWEKDGSAAEALTPVTQ